MEFIKLSKDRYMIKDSNNRVVDEKTKLKLEKQELVLEDIKGCECQGETTKKIKKINKKLSELDGEENGTTTEVVEETTITTE